ncbi:hypothetical protein GCM10029992_12590 [Glycomyces albus]
MRRTVVVAAVAVFAAGCSTSENPGDGAPEPDAPASSEPAEDRPIYGADVTENEFCPTGKAIEALDSTPDNPQVELWHNGTAEAEALDSTSDASQVALHHDGTDYSTSRAQSQTGSLDCRYFYMSGDEEVDRISADFALPEAELEILDEPVEPGDRSILDSSEFPEAPDNFQVTGWEHTATEAETEICLNIYLFEECEDGGTLVREVFTLTGFDSNLEVALRIEYRYGGDPAEYGADQFAEIEARSRRIAAEFVPLLIDGLPVADE